MGQWRLNDSAAFTVVAALLTNLTQISSVLNATVVSTVVATTTVPAATEPHDHLQSEIFGIVYPPIVQEVKTDWHQLQTFKKRDFQDQNPPQTLDEFYSRYDPWTGIGTGLMLGSFIFLLFLNIVIKWTLRQIRNQKQRKLNPELYEMARNWDGRPETLLNCNLSPDLLRVLEAYQKVIFGPEVNFKLPATGDSKDLESKTEVAKLPPPLPTTDKPKIPSVHTTVERVTLMTPPMPMANNPQLNLPVGGRKKLLSLACQQGEVEINLIAPTPAATPSASIRNFSTTLLPLPISTLCPKPNISDRLVVLEDDSSSPIDSRQDILTIAAVHNYNRRQQTIRSPLLQPIDHRGLMRTQSACVRLSPSPTSELQHLNSQTQSNCRQLLMNGGSHQFLHPNRLLDSHHNRRFGSSSSAPAQCLETDL